MNEINKGMAVGVTRRAFTGCLVGGTCVATLMPVAVSAAAHVEESDETAAALGYKHDTKSVDAKKYPKHAATQRCANCAMWQGAATDPWAGCAMFGRKQIAADGWCTAWVNKPG